MSKCFKFTVGFKAVQIVFFFLKAFAEGTVLKSTGSEPQRFASGKATWPMKSRYSRLSIINDRSRLSIVDLRSIGEAILTQVSKMAVI